MLSPEVVRLCQQASVEHNADRLLHLITEINRLIALGNNESRQNIAFTCDRVPVNQVINSNISAASRCHRIS